jgi:hypothetical protein
MAHSVMPRADAVRNRFPTRSLENPEARTGDETVRSEPEPCSAGDRFFESVRASNTLFDNSSFEPHSRFGPVLTGRKVNSARWLMGDPRGGIRPHPFGGRDRVVS